MNTPEELGLATLKRFYKAESVYLASGAFDFAGIAATLDPEVIIHQPASLPYGGTWRGHHGFEAWMRAFAQQWSSLEVTDAELYPIGDIVISKSHVYAVAKTSGQPVDWPLLQFIKIRQGKILELRPFHWDTIALLLALNP